MTQQKSVNSPDVCVGNVFIWLTSDHPLNAITGKGTRKLRTGHAQQTTKVFGMIFSTYYNAKSEQKFPSFVKQYSVTCIGPSQMANKMHNRSKSQLVVLTNVSKNDWISNRCHHKNLKWKIPPRMAVRRSQQKHWRDWPQMALYRQRWRNRIFKSDPSLQFVVQDLSEVSSRAPKFSLASSTWQNFQVWPQSPIRLPKPGGIFNTSPRSQLVVRKQKNYCKLAPRHSSSSTNWRFLETGPKSQFVIQKLTTFWKLAPSRNSSIKKCNFGECAPTSPFVGRVGF